MLQGKLVSLAWVNSWASTNESPQHELSFQCCSVEMRLSSPVQSPVIYPIGLGIEVHAYASRGRGDLGGGVLGVEIR